MLAYRADFVQGVARSGRCSILSGEIMLCDCDRQGALLQNRVEMLIRTKAKFEEEKRSVVFYQIVLYFKRLILT